MKLLTTLICILILSFTVFSQKLSVDTSFAPSINGAVHFMEILSNGKILITGEFSTVNGVTRKGIARLNADGTTDTSFNANWLDGQFNMGVGISAFKNLPDGKVLVTGSLPYDNSLGSIRIRRLNADGSPDTSLTSIPYLASSPSYQIINKIEQLSNGKFLICGNFDLPNGNAKPSIARYNNDGTFDSTFATQLNNDCSDVKLQPDGKYLVSGYYTTINGNPSESLTRFNTDDTIDTSFNAAPITDTTEHTYYYKIKLQNDGTIFAFRAATCCSKIKAARLNSNGSLHTDFATNIENPGDFAVQSNGKVTIVSRVRDVFGQFTEVNRFNTDGTHDPSLNQIGFNAPSSSTYSRAAEFTSDGKLIVAGNYTSVVMVNNSSINQVGLARFSLQAIPVRPKFDFDGDGKADIALYRPSSGIWYVSRSTGGFSATQFGLSTDKPVSADYDGDGKVDLAVFRDGVWYWLKSSDSAFAYQTCGQAGDIPTPIYGNLYTANSNADNLMIFRPSSSPRFYTQRPYQSAQSAEFRSMTLLPTDKPVLADYDGDGKDDLAVFRDGNWFVMKSNSLSTIHYQFGAAGDKAVIGDFDGDLRSDFAVYRPSNGTWYINKSTEGFYAVQWGLADDLPVPADYDGDGKVDIAVFRPSTGVWYIIKSSGSHHIEQFGLTGDIPAQLR